jgi:Uncharacterised nucleotidyltransferase
LLPAREVGDPEMLLELALMSMLNTNTAPSVPGGQLQVREAVLLAFCDPLPERCARLRRLSGNEWRALLPWLDTSGLALYFLDRVIELQLCDMLPFDVLTRLQQNLTDNTERMRGMIDESITIHRDFQSAHLSYATLKGFSLWPHSVPKPELRSQLDLDFLIAEKSVPEARRILERRGYHLHAVSGRSWEFKTNEIPGTSLKDLYKNVSYRCVELHVEANLQGQPSLLARTGKRDFHGIYMPVLSPVDLFLGQGLHVYKHVCSEFSRTAHLLEFRRHVLARREDNSFWRELQSIAENHPRAALGLGLVTLLITHVMGDFAPEPLTHWTAHRLPNSSRLWIEMYGARSVFASFPGSKLYLLLQRELESASVPANRTRRQVLFPLRLPPAITQASLNDSLSVRIRRYRIQLRFIVFRLRFHIVEGLRYTWESFCWRRRMNRLARRGISALDSPYSPTHLPDVHITKPR